MYIQSHENNNQPASTPQSIVIELDGDEQKKIKVAAKAAGLSVQKYILKAIHERMAQDNRSLHLNINVDKTVELGAKDIPYMPHATDEEVFSPVEEAYILRFMQESHAQIPTIREFDQMSGEKQMHTTQRLLTHRRNAIDHLEIRRYVEEFLG